MAKVKDAFLLGMKNLVRRKLRSYLTMIGIFIGIATVVSLISLGQGLKDAVTAQVASLGSDKIIIQARSAGFAPPGFLTSTKITKDDLRTVRSVSGVYRAAGRMLKPATVTFNAKKEIHFIASLPDDIEGRNLVLETLQLKAEMGRILKSGDTYKVLIGPNFAVRENPSFFNKAISVGDRITIDAVSFEVVGIFEKTGKPQIDSALIIPENALRDITHTPEEISVIVVQAGEGVSLTQLSDSLTKALRRHRNLDKGKEDFQVSTPQQLASSVNTIVTVVQSVLIGIAAISLLVGGIGIMNTMYTSVLERKREIGIMKAVGARNSDILQIFLYESGMMGLVGGLLGMLLGISFAKLVEVLAAHALGANLLQASFPLPLLIGSVLFSFLVGITSGVLPALQASKLPPVKALRRE